MARNPLTAAPAVMIFGLLLEKPECTPPAGGDVMGSVISDSGNSSLNRQSTFTFASPAESVQPRRRGLESVMAFLMYLAKIALFLFPGGPIHETFVFHFLRSSIAFFPSNCCAFAVPSPRGFCLYCCRGVVPHPTCCAHHCHCVCGEFEDLPPRRDRDNAADGEVKK